MTIAAPVQQCLGVLDFLLRPRHRASWGGPFNGQRGRQVMFLEIVERVGFDAIVETGTYRGTTTAYLHESTGLPVHTVELKPRHYRYARTRFAFTSGISVHPGDSRDFLRRYARMSGGALTGKLFFYLDAHWDGPFPVRDEILLIATAFPNAVMMIDDFKVPDDAGYAYDENGDGTALTPEYIAPVVGRIGASLFLPVIGARQETGLRRGCVVLACATPLVDRLKAVTTLRQWNA